MYSEDKYWNREKLLDEVLKTEPQFNLSANFADIVAEKAGRKFAWNNYIREFLIYLGVIFGLLTVPVALQFIFFEANPGKWFEIISGNIIIIGGVAILLIFVLFTDRVLLRYFMERKNPDQI